MMADETTTVTKKKKSKVPHGTAGGYTNHHCRCSKCRRAFAEASAKAAEERRKKGLPPGDERHGTLNGYGNWGCRCESCKDAKAKERAAAKALAL